MDCLGRAPAMDAFSNAAIVDLANFRLPKPEPLDYRIEALAGSLKGEHSADANRRSSRHRRQRHVAEDQDHSVARNRDVPRGLVPLSPGLVNFGNKVSAAQVACGLHHTGKFFFFSTIGAKYFNTLS